MYKTIRPLIFNLDPERAHQLTLSLLRAAGSLPPIQGALRKIFAVPDRPVDAFGLTFRNPIGLAAGYDKDAVAVRGLAALGFGHIEVGTITPLAQAGNPKPRVFRLPEDRGVVNRLGFPGQGAAAVEKNLSIVRSQPNPFQLGINIGKNKDTPNEEAKRDYLLLLEKFAPLADYLTVNVSSPNTVGLRRLQAKESLEKLLGALASARGATDTPRPVLVKLAPDLTDDELDDSLDAIISTGMDGVIATNTTIRREGLRSSNAKETGGLSGEPLKKLSTEIIEKIHQRTAGKLPVIGVGGIMSPDDAKAKMDAGALLVQVYTGMIYAGPGFVKQLMREL